jgi:phage gp16-like protein
MIDEEEYQKRIREGREMLAFLAANAEKLGQKGLNVPEASRRLSRTLAEMERLTAKCNETQDKLLHAQADVADLERDYFKSICKVLDPIAEERPFDPAVQEWLELRAAWLKQLPREDADQ